ncbi:MAG: metallophosphoesterase [Bacillota bacterium]
MSIFAIADLHLSFHTPKPMDIFGQGWQSHPQKIADAWRDRVADDDWVLLPGDFSWAMKPEEVRPDLDYLASLPGSKVMIRGNHDYWWQTKAKMKQLLPPRVYALDRTAIGIPGHAVAGSRGWISPGSTLYETEEDEKIYLRELGRFEASLQEASALGLPIIAMLHYPPTNERHEPSGFSDLMERYGVRICLYGHLHGESRKSALEGDVRGIRYHLVSCDHLGFSPLIISRCE